MRAIASPIILRSDWKQGLDSEEKKNRACIWPEFSFPHTALPTGLKTLNLRLTGEKYDSNSSNKKLKQFDWSLPLVSGLMRGVEPLTTLLLFGTDERSIRWLLNQHTTLLYTG